MTISRRDFLRALLGGAGLTAASYYLGKKIFLPAWEEPVFIAQGRSYQDDLAGRLLSGFRELGIRPEEIKGKRILLKPNLVETSLGVSHINTHPLVVRGAVEAFYHLGAAQVIVAEGPGHIHDSLLVLEESGLAEILWEDKIPFLDLNYDSTYTMVNAGRFSRLKTLTFPAALRQVDWIVSLAKLKTHHWAGVTLSLKNLFGVMPGIIYGWPKNVLHQAGIQQCILDIAATLKPHFAIVDGIVGMEGDGPIMGTPKEVGVLVMGRNLAAVDATCARIMGIEPFRVKYLEMSDGLLGPVARECISQRGEALTAVTTNFHLVDKNTGPPWLAGITFLFPRLRSTDYYLALGLALLNMSLGYLIMVPGICGIYHDDGVYISTAKALAQGDGYRLINLPNSPPQTKYPIIFPALLSIIWKLWPSFPNNILAMQWLTLTFAGLATGLSYLYLVMWNYTSRRVALLAGTLAATSLVYLYFGTLVLSEMPFAFFTLVALMALERYLDVSTSHRGRQFFLGALLAIPYLTRSIGIVLLLVSAGIILWRRRPFFWVALGMTVAVLPWISWSILAPQWGESIVTAYYTNYLSWWQFVIGGGSWGNVIITNFFLIFPSLVFSGLAILFVTDLFKFFPLGLFLLGLLSLTNIVHKIWQRPILPAFLLSYLLITLVWPWPPNRFLIPLLPLLWAFLLDGLMGFLRRFLILGRSCLPILLLGSLLLSSNVLVVYLYCQKYQQDSYPAIKLTKDYPHWSDYLEVFDWIRKNIQPGEIVGYGMDTMLYLYTGHKSFRPFMMQPLSIFYGEATTMGGILELKNFLEIYQANYLIQTPMPEFSEEKPFDDLIQEVQELYPDWLTPVFQGHDKRFRIFRIHPDKSP